MSDIRRYQEEMRKIELLTPKDVERFAAQLHRITNPIEASRAAVHIDEPPHTEWWYNFASNILRRGRRVIPNPRRLDDGVAGGVCGPPCWGMLVYVVALAVLKGWDVG